MSSQSNSFAAILDAWSGQLVIDKQLGPNVWNVNRQGELLILKRRSRSFNSEQERSILVSLRGKNLPVAIPLLTKEGAAACTLNVDQWSLYPRLPGRHKQLVEMTLADARVLGAVLGRLHSALDGIVGCNLPEFVLPSELNECRRGVIHRDFHATNVLYKEGQVSGVVDFDLLCKGPRVFDLAYLGASLLADAWEQSSAKRVFCPVLAHIVSGYQETCNLIPQEIAAIPTCLEVVEGLFVSLGKDLCNKQMETGAATVREWFKQQQSTIHEALRGIS